MTLAMVRLLPVYLSIWANRSELHELTFEPKIAALIYLIENRNAAMKQNATPANLLLILHTPINFVSPYFTKINQNVSNIIPHYYSIPKQIKLSNILISNINIIPIIRLDLLQIFICLLKNDKIIIFSYKTFLYNLIFSSIFIK